MNRDDNEEQYNLGTSRPEGGAVCCSQSLAAFESPSGSYAECTDGIRGLGISAVGRGGWCLIVRSAESQVGSERRGSSTVAGSNPCDGPKWQQNSGRWEGCNHRSLQLHFLVLDMNGNTARLPGRLT